METEVSVVSTKKRLLSPELPVIKRPPGKPRKKEKLCGVAEANTPTVEISSSDSESDRTSESNFEADKDEEDSFAATLDSIQQIIMSESGKGDRARYHLPESERNKAVGLLN